MSDRGDIKKKVNKIVKVLPELNCGKGGCGKSTISTLPAKETNRRKNKVLAIDTDELNFGLNSHLGMDSPQDFMNYFGGKKVLFEQVENL